MLVVLGRRNPYTGVDRKANVWFDILPGMIGICVESNPGMAGIKILFGETLVSAAHGVMVKYESNI